MSDVGGGNGAGGSSRTKPAALAVRPPDAKVTGLKKSHATDRVSRSQTSQKPFTDFQSLSDAIHMIWVGGVNPEAKYGGWDSPLQEKDGSGGEVNRPAWRVQVAEKLLKRKDFARSLAATSTKVAMGEAQEELLATARMLKAERQI